MYAFIHVVYICMYVQRREIMGAVPASAPAATATTICSANICTEHPEGVPRGVFSLCERIQVQREIKDHCRSNGKRQWERQMGRKAEKVVKDKKRRQSPQKGQQQRISGIFSRITLSVSYLVWYGMIWCGVVWYGMAQCGNACCRCRRFG